MTSVSFSPGAVKVNELRIAYRQSIKTYLDSSVSMALPSCTTDQTSLFTVTSAALKLLI